MESRTAIETPVEPDTDARGREIPVPDYSEEEEEDQTDTDHNAKTTVPKIDADSTSRSTDNNQLTPSDDDGGLLISPKKLVNPCLVSKEHKALRQELMLNRKLGKNPTEKPELMKVLKERQEKEKKKEMEEHLKSKRTDFDIRLEEQAQKINQAEQLQHQELEQMKKEAEKPEFFKVHSKIIKTKSDSWPFNFTGGFFASDVFVFSNNAYNDPRAARGQQSGFYALFAKLRLDLPVKIPLLFCREFLIGNLHFSFYDKCRLSFYSVV